MLLGARPSFCEGQTRTLRRGGGNFVSAVERNNDPRATKLTPGEAFILSLPMAHSFLPQSGDTRSRGPYKK